MLFKLIGVVRLFRFTDDAVLIRFTDVVKIDQLIDSIAALNI